MLTRLELKVLRTGRTSLFSRESKLGENNQILVPKALKTEQTLILKVK